MKGGDAVALLPAAALLAAAAAPGSLQAVWRIGREPLVLEAREGFAGAVSSIRFRGREYLGASDHGRELQAAVQFGAGECLNPTLAGAARDPPGVSTSVRLEADAGPRRYHSVTRMAYWAAPGRRCSLGPHRRGRAVNDTRLSDLVYEQTMTPGFGGHANAVADRIVITAAADHPPAAAEVLTGYMPGVFDTFWVYRPFERRFEVDRGLAEPSSETDGAVMVSTADGSAAMGVAALGGEGRASYAAFHDPRVSKWSLLYRTAGRFRAGRHAWRAVWAIGTRAEVGSTLSDILARRDRPGAAPGLIGVLAGVAAILLAGAAIAFSRRRRGPLQPLGR